MTLQPIIYEESFLFFFISAINNIKHLQITMLISKSVVEGLPISHKDAVLS